jgi:RNA polymerase sigma-70 factor, ECF subfamily
LEDEFTAGLLQLIPKLRVHALTLTRDRTAAEDLVQDTVVNALAARESFKPGTNFAAWTHAILRNRFISLIRRRREMVDLEAAPEAAFAATGAQEDRLVLKELSRALARLAPEQREVLIMAVVLGMSYEDIAAALDCAEGTAKSKVFRARRTLRAMLLGNEGQISQAPYRTAVRFSSHSAKHRAPQLAQ